MITVDIPIRTLQYELASLEDAQPIGYSELYVAGAKAAIQWMIDGKKTPTQAMEDLFGIAGRLH